MIKKIVFVCAAAVVALLVILSIDRYNDLRQEQSSDLAVDTLVAEETTAETVTSEVTTADPTAAAETTSVESEEPSTYTGDLEAIDYVDASVALGASFTGRIVAESAILIDINSKSIVYSKNAEERLSPASTTKLMTALTALKYLDPDEKIVVGNEIYLIGSESSTSSLVVGDELTVEQLLQGMLISSGNDAAYVLAVNTGRKVKGNNVKNDLAVKQFVKLMNNNVKLLGLENTNFSTPDGYDSDNQFSTAKDLAIIACAAYENDTIKDICNIQSIYIPEKGITWTNTNELINPNSEYYFDKAIGMKTGSTGAAGKCLISAAIDDGEQYISVVLNSSEEGRWDDSIILLEYGLSIKIQP